MVVHEKVPVGYGDVDRARFERGVALRRRRRQGSVAVEDLGQHARRVGRHVQHDQDRVGKIRGEVRGEVRQRLHPAGGRANRHDAT